MPTVLITGAGGFTGQYLAANLAAHGYQCKGILSRSQEPAPAALSDALVCNLLDSETLQAAVSRLRPDYVVHLAAIAFVAHGDADAMYRTNVVGTRNLLEALVHLPAAPKLTLLASSANVYGNANSGVVAESVAPAPANDYAVSKLAMEHMARLYASRLPLTIARPFNYTGVGQSESFLIPKIVSYARRAASQIELGNIEVARDFSDVRTVVQSYRRLLECPQAAGRTLNVCSGKAWTLRQVLSMVREITGRDMEIHVNPALVRANEVKVLKGDRSALGALIGPIEDIPFEDTLRWMLQGATSPLPGSGYDPKVPSN